jgi:Fe2+ transport system protein FeoA
MGGHGLIPGMYVTVAPRQLAADAVTVRPTDREAVTIGANTAAKILVSPEDV